MAQIHARGDRIIGRFLLLHALAALGLGFAYQTWFVTLTVSGAALAMFFAGVWLAPKSFLTRCVAGVSLQTFVALHIYQMHGLAEQHFWFFTAFTMMIVYQDWRSMWPGTLLIIAQHILFAVLHNSGVQLYFFEDPFIGVTKLFFHFGIAIVQVGICGYWAHLLRQQTLGSAWRQGQLQEKQALLEDQLERTRRSKSELQDKTGELIAAQQMLVQDAARRRRAEDALRQLSQLQTAILDSANYSIISTTPDGTIRSLNAAAQRWLGYDPEDVVGKAPFTVVHDATEVEARAQKLSDELGSSVAPGFSVFSTRAELGLAHEQEWTYLRRDGSRFPVMLSVTALRDAEDRITGFLGVASDISDRKRAEAALCASEERNQALLRAVPDMMFVVRRDGQFGDCRGGRDLSPHQFIGGSLRDLRVVPEDLNRLIEQVGQAIDDGQLHCLEFRQEQGNEMAFWEARAVALNDREAFLIVRDITERKEAEAALVESEERYRDLFENASDLIQTVTPDGRFLYANRAWLQTLGYAAEEISGLSLWDLVHPDCRDHCAKPFQQVLVSDGSVSLEATFVSKDGRTVQIEGSLSCRRIQGRVVCVRGIFRNVTEKKQLESQMLRSQRLESIGRLAGGIAHDLNNVLAPIIMAAQLLRRKLPASDDRELLDSVEGSAGRGAGMIRQLLTFARGAEGERVSVHLGTLIAEMARITRETFPRQIQIRTSSDPELWAVRGDGTQLHQVLMNLCVNARDAMPDGGVLEMSAANVELDEPFVRAQVDAKSGPWVVVMVRDTGTGIPRHLLDRVFEPFFTTKEVGSGTGLGLATVLGIIKSHGGFLTLASEAGQGTHFKVYLPAAQDTDVVAAVSEPDEPMHGSGELILIVDDEADVRRVTRAALVGNGYQVLTANNGAEAVALYASRLTDIHAVITDMSMPVMDGPATVRALLKLNPSVRLLAVSGLMERGKVEPLVRSGLVTFLGKPFSAPRLLTTLRDVLTGRRVNSNTQFFYEKNPDY
jgi:PAS domain S-box-containing protein